MFPFHSAPEILRPVLPVLRVFRGLRLLRLFRVLRVFRAGLLIGLSLDTLKEARWQVDRRVFVEHVQKLGGRVLDLAGVSVERRGPHVLRHTFGRMYLLNGGDLVSVESQRKRDLRWLSARQNTAACGCVLHQILGHTMMAKGQR